MDRKTPLFGLLFYAVILFTSIIFFPLLSLSFGQTAAFSTLVLVGLLFLHTLYRLSGDRAQKITQDTNSRKSFGRAQVLLFILSAVSLALSYYASYKFDHDLKRSPDYLYQYNPMTTNLLALTLAGAAISLFVKNLIKVPGLDPHQTKSEGKRILQIMSLIFLIGPPVIFSLVATYEYLPSVRRVGQGDLRAIDAGYKRCHALDYTFYKHSRRSFKRIPVNIYITYVKAPIAGTLNCNHSRTAEKK